MNDQNKRSGKIAALFSHLSIEKKLLLGYLPLAILIIIVALYALATLERLNRINSNIIERDVPLADTAEKMNDSLLAQEFYGRRYAILKSPEMLQLFWKRSEEFRALTQQAASIEGTDSSVTEKILSLHDRYNDIFVRGFEFLGDPSSSGPAGKYDAGIRKMQSEIVELIKKMIVEARKDQTLRSTMSAEVGNRAFHTIAVLGVSGILLGIGAAVLITRNIYNSIHQLKIATQEISEGRFDYRPSLQNRDELGELSYAFGEMAKRLKELEEMCLDANPLTRLPGGSAVENVLKDRLRSGTPLAFCLIDIDNFKAFSDRYGYARGSDVIRTTAGLIESAVARCGAREDFIGHIGGDDFVVLTTPDRYRRICNEVTRSFDEIIPSYYDREDRLKGFIRGRTRQGEDALFPIATISIAVVTNEGQDLACHTHVGELAAELKEYAKSLPGSIYVVNGKRTSPDENAAGGSPTRGKAGHA